MSTTTGKNSRHVAEPRPRVELPALLPSLRSPDCDLIRVWLRVAKGNVPPARVHPRRVRAHRVEAFGVADILTAIGTRALDRQVRPRVAVGSRGSRPARSPPARPTLLAGPVGVCVSS